MNDQTYSERAEDAKARSEAPEAVADAIAIQCSDGARQVHIDRFPALEGYEISRAYRNYVMSKEPDFRRAFVLNVLQYARVDDIPLDSAETINRMVETWRNVERIFFAILKTNDIDQQLEEEKTNYWSFAGADLATAFIAASAKLLLPLMQSMEDDAKDENADKDQGA